MLPLAGTSAVSRLLSEQLASMALLYGIRWHALRERSGLVPCYRCREWFPRAPTLRILSGLVDASTSPISVLERRGDTVVYLCALCETAESHEKEQRALDRAARP